VRFLHTKGMRDTTAVPQKTVISSKSKSSIWSEWRGFVTKAPQEPEHRL
jgi:hypothetical protein